MASVPLNASSAHVIEVQAINASATAVLLGVDAAEVRVPAPEIFNVEVSVEVTSNGAIGTTAVNQVVPLMRNLSIAFADDVGISQTAVSLAEPVLTTGPPLPPPALPPPPPPPQAPIAVTLIPSTILADTITQIMLAGVPATSSDIIAVFLPAGTTTCDGAAHLQTLQGGGLQGSALDVILTAGRYKLCLSLNGAANLDASFTYVHGVQLVVARTPPPPPSPPSGPVASVRGEVQTNMTLAFILLGAGGMGIMCVAIILTICMCVRTHHGPAKTSAGKGLSNADDTSSPAAFPRTMSAPQKQHQSTSNLAINNRRRSHLEINEPLPETSCAKHHSAGCQATSTSTESMHTGNMLAESHCARTASALMPGALVASEVITPFYPDTLGARKQSSTNPSYPSGSITDRRCTHNALGEKSLRSRQGLADRPPTARGLRGCATPSSSTSTALQPAPIAVSQVAAVSDTPISSTSLTPSTSCGETALACSASMVPIPEQAKVPARASSPRSQPVVSAPTGRFAAVTCVDEDSTSASLAYTEEGAPLAEASDLAEPSILSAVLRRLSVVSTFESETRPETMVNDAHQDHGKALMHQQRPQRTLLPFTPPVPLPKPSADTGIGVSCSSCWSSDDHAPDSQSLRA